MAGGQPGQGNPENTFLLPPWVPAGFSTSENGRGGGFGLITSHWTLPRVTLSVTIYGGLPQAVGQEFGSPPKHRHNCFLLLPDLGCCGFPLGQTRVWWAEEREEVLTPVWGTEGIAGERFME